MRRSAWALGAWLASTPAAAELPAGTSVQFRVAAPEGFAPVPEASAPSLAAVFSRPVWRGHALFTVERHVLVDGLTPERFARGLAGDPESPPRGKDWKEGERRFQVWGPIVLMTPQRRLGPDDPYAPALGTEPGPPKLSFLESRRFPVSGEAYRLYRCREQGQWGLLRDYHAARASSDTLREFQARWLTQEGRRAVAACFGTETALGLESGAAVPVPPKPSMYRLRLLARDEWATGLARVEEWEWVHLRPSGGVLWALRCRAPRWAWESVEPDCRRFLASFEPL